MESSPSFSSPPPPQADSSDKALAVLCHLSFIIGLGFILPLVIYLVKRNESPFVAAQSREVLNFHLSVLIYSICIFPLIFILIGFLLYFVLAIGALVFAIIGAIRAGEGGFYHYPLTLRLI